MERRTVKVLSPLQMAVFTRDSSTKMKSQEKEFTTGLIRRRTEGLGLRTKCMVMVSSSGLMASSTKECLKMISVKAMASSPGRMAEYTTVSGKMVNRTERVSSLIKKTSREEASGKVVKTSSG